MHSSQSYHDKFWAIVTVFGTLWGGLELTLGTFLHTLHVPKTGLIMVSLSLILLIAQRRIFPARGLTICTGVIAACIKSLSPGGIIVGPMIGILSEALVVELFLLPGSRNYFSGIIAGGMGILWSQLISVFRKWIIYGDDFIKALFKFVSKFLTLESTSTVGWTLLAIALGLIFFAGGIAGFLGGRLGRRVEKRIAAIDELDAQNSTIAAPPKDDDEENSPINEEIPEESTPDMIASLSSQKHAQADEQVLKTRKYILPIAVITLGIQILAGFFVQNDLWWTIPALAVWIITLAIGALNVLKSIWWPKFWLISIIVSLLCGLILAIDFEGGWNFALGIEAAVRMLTRGIFVFSWINWFTRSIRTSEFLGIWQKLRMPNLGHALTKAYSLLPAWLDRMNELVKNRPKGFINNIKYIHECILVCLVEAVRQTDDL
ncbi:MAG: hypothetical protein J6A01_05705 [Proteobacteria bacterium]|nr:hypothetical protein [Pseudomonadota bacterium]